MIRRAIVFTLCVLASTNVAAEQPERPKIGLVLSGGGALGSAHVGVLKVLDELNVPIHCVAGTSMGAIVGGLYAAGYSPQELESILLDINWRDLLDDRAPRRLVPFRRKVDDLTFLSRLELGFNKGRLAFPPAIVQGQKMDFLLQVLTVHTVGTESFDDLPIPFRAVATDLETGAEVVLDHGDLARAIRASMAVPGVFAPSVIDDRVLVDGGLVNNLPVDLAWKMGADVVIAVDVGEPLKTREQLKSLTSVAGQVMSMSIRRNVGRQIADADLVIFPDLQGFSASDFHKADEMIMIGEDVARASADELAEYSIDPAEYADIRLPLQRRQIGEPTIVGVEVTLDSHADPEFVLSKIRTRPGDALDGHAIARDLERLYAEGDYERVTFFLTKEDGGYTLNIEAHEKSWGPHLMRFGLNMSADLEGDSDFNLLANYTMTRLNRLRGEVKLVAQIGSEGRLGGELYQPLHRSGRFFVAPSLQVLNTSVATSPIGGGSGRFTVTLLNAGLDLGLSLHRWGELRVGLDRSSGRARPKDGGPDLPDLDFDRGGFRARLILDQLDNPNFPKNGWIANGEFYSARESLGSDLEYNRLQSGVFGAASTGRHTLLASLEYDTALGSDLPSYEEFTLGGLFRLSGYSPSSISGPYLGLATASYYYQVADFGTSLLSGIYVGTSLEAGNVWKHNSDAGLDDLLYSGSLYVGMDSYFGPLYLAYGRGDKHQDAWYLYIGRSF